MNTYGLPPPAGYWIAVIQWGGGVRVQLEVARSSSGLSLRSLLYAATPILVLALGTLLAEVTGERIIVLAAAAAAVVAAGFIALR